MLPRSVEVAQGIAQDESTPIVLNSDGYEFFSTDTSDSAMETPANVDPETGEIQEETDDKQSA